MIIYTNQCIGCHNRRRMNEIRRFCSKHKIKYEERRISYSKLWQDQARAYAHAFDVSVPFIMHNDKAINLYGNLEDLL